MYPTLPTPTDAGGAHPPKEGYPIDNKDDYAKHQRHHHRHHKHNKRQDPEGIKSDKSFYLAGVDHDEESNKLETPSPKNKRLSKDPAGFESSNGMYSTPYVSTSMPEQVTIELKNDEKKQNHNEVPSQEPTFSENWTHLILRLKSPILRILFAITGHASKNPKSYVLGCLLLSTILMGSGFARGINLDVNQDEAWTPEGSKPLAHGEWLEDESGFPQIPKWFLIFIHADGKNLLGQDGVARTFEALGVFRETKGYQEICAQSDEAHGMLLRGNMTCAIYSASAFWNHSVSIFNEEISSDQEAIVALSAEHFPDGQHVDPQMIYGLPLQGDDGILESVLAYATNIAIPPIDDESSEFEKEATARLLDLQEQWDEDPDNLFRLEFFGYDSFTEEFTRAIVKDIPLLPVVFVIMSILSCVFYAKWDIIQSRSLLGFGAVVTVLLGIMCGYGLMFLSGVAFTSLTQILPFILFGVGLDNSFIIIGSYRRKDLRKDAAVRIRETIEDIGGSITLTTLTTATAFALGCISTIPAVFCLCYYAIPCILFGYLGQLTFFVALVVIDEKRIQENRRDCVFWCKPSRSEEEEEEGSQPMAHLSDRIMKKYGDFLMQKSVKIIVLLGFASLFGTMVWQATFLTQFFDFKDLVPSDSYIIRAVDALDKYYTRKGVAPMVVFRFVDQSSLSIQDQMEQYVNDLVDLEQILHQPPFFWLREFKVFVNSTDYLQELSFEDQIDAFLNISTYKSMYGGDIVRSEDKNVTASRTKIYMDNFDWDVIKEQTKALSDQRHVTENQLINKGTPDWPFFSFDETYYIWEFYEVAVSEMKITTIVGVISVSVLSMLFVAHWTAVFFVAPLVAILYVDLLGVIHLSGLYINSVTYIGVLMSIGLIVDYTMHIILRFIESPEKTREAKTKETLCTMGASILLGGVSTLLGVLPLYFSTSDIFHTIFVIFIGLVTLGIGHGLILLPVVLSLIGPLSHIPAKSWQHIDPSSDGDITGGRRIPGQSSLWESPIST